MATNCTQYKGLEREKGGLSPAVGHKKKQMLGAW